MIAATQFDLKFFTGLRGRRRRVDSVLLCPEFFPNLVNIEAVEL